VLDGCKRKRCAWSCLNNLSIWNWGTQYAHQNVGIVILWNFDAALFFHTSAILTQIYSSYLCSVQGAPSNRKVSPTRRQKTFTNEYQQSSIKFQLAWTNNLVCLNKSRFRWKKIISKEALIWSVYIYSNSLPLVALTIISFFNLQGHRGAIDLTPWVVSIPVSFLLFTLYNYVQSWLTQEQESWEVQFNLYELSVYFGSRVM